MDALQTFLQQQKILQIAPHAGDPWIANVLMMSKEPEKIMFIGSKKTLYGQKLTEDPKLAFATAWHAEDSHVDRKGIQGVGEAVPSTNEDEIFVGVTMHNERYPEFAHDVTVEHVLSNSTDTSLWIITPSYIKFWSDEHYDRNGSEEFNF